MANEYGRWFVRNDPQTWRQNFGAYNRPFGERYERPSEYTPSVDEYRHYPAMKDIAAEQEEKKKQLEQKDNPQEKNSARQRSTQQRMRQMRGRQATQNIIKNIAGKAIAVVGGGAIVVVGTQAILAEMAAPIEEPAPIVQEVQADWQAWDAIEMTIMVQLKDAEGNVIKEVPAVITLTEIDPTCTQEGSKTYTATAEDGGQEYSDSYTEVLEPTGHTLDGGTVGTDEQGNSVIVYECSECHEHFEVAISAEEND